MTDPLPASYMTFLVLTNVLPSIEMKKRKRQLTSTPTPPPTPTTPSTPTTPPTTPSTPKTPSTPTSLGRSRFNRYSWEKMNQTGLRFLQEFCEKNNYSRKLDVKDRGYHLGVQHGYWDATSGVEMRVHYKIDNLCKLNVNR